MSARGQNPLSFLVSLPLIRLMGEDPMCQSIDTLALQLGLPESASTGAHAGLRVHTSRLALELVKRGVGWTVVDYLTASNLDASAITAVPLHDFAHVPLQMYCAAGTPLGQTAKRMLDMLPELLRGVMAPSHQGQSASV